MSTKFCLDLNVKPHKKRPYLELPFDVVIGYILLFFYFNAKEGKTWCIVLPYHLLTFVETVVLSVTFYVERPNEWYSLMILCLTILLFTIGSTLMLMYYAILHPKTKNYWIIWSTRHIHHTNANGSTTRINTVRQASNDS